MLKDLDVLNGEMTLEFDPLNTIYTIRVSGDATALDLAYEVSDEAKVSIKGNNLDNAKNEVVLSVYNDDMSTSYYLYVYKEESDSVTSNLESLTALQLENEEISEYAVPIIASLCFLIILLTFALLFSKKTRH